MNLEEAVDLLQQHGYYADGGTNNLWGASGSFHFDKNGNLDLRGITETFKIKKEGMVWGAAFYRGQLEMFVKISLDLHEVAAAIIYLFDLAEKAHCERRDLINALYELQAANFMAEIESPTALKVYHALATNSPLHPYTLMVNKYRLLDSRYSCTIGLDYPGWLVSVFDAVGCRAAVRFPTLATAVTGFFAIWKNVAGHE